MVQDAPERAVQIWRSAATRLLVGQVIGGWIDPDTDPYFLWKMAQRRWMMESGIEEFSEPRNWL